MFLRVLQVMTTDEFARWFGALDDALAEDVAAALDMIEQLGPDRAAPGSRESLLWYEHPNVARFDAANPIAYVLESWGEFRDYARRLLAKLESPRFVSRLERLPPAQATAALKAVRRIKGATDPRAFWAQVLHAPRSGKPLDADVTNARAQLRSAYFAALEAVGFQATDVPAHSLALRELARREPAPAFRLLYGVDVGRETALFVLGERLDRTFYGDSVRRAEATWAQFLAGDLRSTQPMPLR